jgi:hypothetical protein
MKRNEQARGDRKALHRAVWAGAIMVGGLLLVRGLEASLRLTFEKPPRALSKPLPLLKKAIGQPVRYVAEGLDSTLDPGIVDTLGTKEYLLRKYIDETKKPGEIGRELNLNLNYYGTGSASPHVPEICWAGAGMEQAPQSKDEFVIEGVRRKDGTVDNVRMRMISFIPNQTDAAGLGLGMQTGDKLLNVAYLFEVNGKCVAKPQEVTSEFWNAAAKYAYHTKIEVTVPAYCSPAQAQAAISDFIRASLAEIEECLPEREGAGETSGGAPPNIQETR